MPSDGFVLGREQIRSTELECRIMSSGSQNLGHPEQPVLNVPVLVLNECSVVGTVLGFGVETSADVLLLKTLPDERATLFLLKLSSQVMEIIKHSLRVLQHHFRITTTLAVLFGDVCLFLVDVF